MDAGAAANRPPKGRWAGLAAAAAAAVQPATECEALQEVSAAFGSLLSDLSFSFVVASARADDLPLIYASQGFYECTGYRPEEVLGRNCRFLQGPATSHQAVMEIRDAIREERPCSICLLNYRKDGSFFWNFFSLAPVRAPCGMVEYYVGVQADVTRLAEVGAARCPVLAARGEEAAVRAAELADRLAAHEAELREADRTQKCAVLECVPSSLLAVVSRVQESFVLADPHLPDCPIVYASPAFLRLTGYPCCEVVGHNCRFLQGPGTDPEAVQRVRQALAAEPPTPVTVTLLNYRKPGVGGWRQPFWNMLHISPLRDADGKVQFFAGVQADVTAAACTAGGGGISAAGSAVGAAAAEAAQQAAAVATGGPPEPDPLVLLRQQGVVGSLRVATRALAPHGLRRAEEFQRAPCRRG